MAGRITHFVRGLVLGALHLLPMTNPQVPATFTLAAVSGFVLSIGTASGQTKSPRRYYDIDHGEAATALKRFSEESGQQVVYLVDSARGLTTNQVKGEFTAREALERLIANTVLIVVEDRTSGALMIERVIEKPSSKQANPPPKDLGTTRNPVARKTPLAILGAWLALAVTPLSPAHAADGTSEAPGAKSDPIGAGIIEGAVYNSATGNMLEGAKIELQGLGLATVTDNTGRFVFADVPVGTYNIVTSYTGLDPMRITVIVGQGQRKIQDFALTAEVYRMQAFTVTGEREGDAAAITAQRNSSNVKNVVAMDSFGNLPNMNAAEVAIRLAGVAGTLDGSGMVTGFSVRGAPSGLNVVTMDGGLLTSANASSRAGSVNNITGSMFDQVEVIKGHTPDKGADSLGGTINFKSRSPLSMREKRRVTYNFLARTAPSFTQQIPLREARRTHASGNVAYQEVFDAFGGERNLGVSVNLFSSEQGIGYFNTTRDYQNTPTSPAYLWDYRTRDVYNHRRQHSVNVKSEYRYSPSTKLTFLAMFSDHSEGYGRSYITRAYTTQQVGTSGTAGILPGFTDHITQVRAAPGSTINMTSTGPNNNFNRLRRIDLGAEHEWGPLKVDYNARYTQTHLNGAGSGGNLLNSLSGIGWILDRTQSDLYPRFIQTEGPDFTDPANYRPAPNGLNYVNTKQYHKVTELLGNLRYDLPVSLPVFIKTGFQWREQVVGVGSASRRWNYTGTTALPANQSIVVWDALKTGRRIPQWQASDFIQAGSGEVINPSLWREDLYFREQGKFTGTGETTETVAAGYVMAQGRLGREGLLGRTGFIGGVRTEKTDTEGWGWTRARTLSTPAQQVADPIGSAQRDYANTRREISGSYTKSFPSVHLTHDVNRNLKARMSWSTSFGRPAFTNARPTETPNEAQQTLSVSNPGLLPQNAKNWDATLEYYFEPVGSLSVGWFHKTIKDYIVTGINSGTVGSGTDNGYNGEYGGFTLLRAANAGTAVVQGWEFGYQQQFTFLPRFLKGLRGFANLAVIDTQGNFGGQTNLSTGQVADFIPRTGNAGLTWSYKRFSTRLLYNYTGTYLNNYSAIGPHRNIYRAKRSITNLGLAYQVRPSLSVTLDIDNLFNEPQSLYFGIADRLQDVKYPGIGISVGLNGRF